MKRKPTMAALHSIAALLILCGCAPVLVPTAYEVHKPANAGVIPLRAGLSLTPKFKKHAFVGNQGGAPVVIPIGDAMAAGAERSMREVFESVVSIEGSDSSSTAKGVAVIVTPEIVEVDNRSLGFPSRWDSRVACKWTITGRDGKLFYVNTITGEGQYKAFTTAFTLGDHLGRSMLPAIQDHYNKLIAHLLSVKWWEDVK